MKKIFAILALAASTAAFAQTSVTITGKFGAAYQKAMGSVGNLAVTDGDVNLAATENLGNGLKAGATIGLRTRGREYVEGGNSSSNTAANGFGAQEIGRDATVFVEGGFGRVTLGSIAHGNGIAGNGWAGTTVALPKDLNNGGVLSGETYANTLAYTSPNFSGFVVSAARLDSIGKVGVGNTSNLSTNNDRGVSANSVGLAYAKGPLTAGIDYTAFANGTDSSSKSDQTRIRASAAYDFGMIKVGFGHEDNKATSGGTSGLKVGAYDGKQTTFGASVPVTSNLRAGVVYAKNTEATAVGADNGSARATGFGADYSFSKRTVLNVSYAKIKREDTNDVTKEGNQYRARLMHSF